MALSSKHSSCTAVAAIIATVFIGAVALVAQKKTTKDGVFSADQAKRGAVLYKVQCSGCHANDLGGGPAPQLAGTDFLNYWEDKPVAELVSMVKENMPQIAPGTLSKAETVDVVSFILSSNKMPAGRSDLPIDDAVLTQVVIVK
jgi:quinoprotein glucose dehydrogenase